MGNCWPTPALPGKMAIICGVVVVYAAVVINKYKNRLAVPNTNSNNIQSQTLYSKGSSKVTRLSVSSQPKIT